MADIQDPAADELPPVVIFLHGVASTPATWNAVVRALAPDFDCICPPLPGHGNTAWPGPELVFDALVDDLERLRDARRAQRIFLVGHSLGAFIAAAYAARFREHVAGLALLAAPAYRTPSDLSAGLTALAAMRRNGVMQVVTTLVNSWYTPEFVRLHPDAVERRLSEIRSIHPDAFTAAYELYVEADLAWWLPYLSGPTLIMTGEHARGCSADHARSAARTLTNGELVLLDGQRNGILTEVPDLVAGHLREFFTPITALARGALSAPAGSGRG